MQVDMTEVCADPVDRASLEEQRNLQLNIQAALAKTVKALPYIGQCYNCDELLPPGNRFCDADCRDDHQKRERSRSVRGV